MILQRKLNGQYLTPEIVAHFEYFMNTLNMGYKHQTENPFDHPLKYPALMYKGMTLMPSPETSENAIMESAEPDENSSASSSVDGDDNMLVIIDTEDIIDQSMLLAESQMRIESGAVNNKTPQEPGKQANRLSVAPSKQERKLSVRHEIRRQSNMYLHNLSIYERNQLLIKPKAHMKKVRDMVRNDKKSILSSQGSEIGYSDGSHQSHLIEQ